MAGEPIQVGNEPRRIPPDLRGQFVGLVTPGLRIVRESPIPGLAAQTLRSIPSKSDGRSESTQRRTGCVQCERPAHLTRKGPTGVLKPEELIDGVHQPAGFILLESGLVATIAGNFIQEAPS